MLAVGLIAVGATVILGASASDPLADQRAAFQFAYAGVREGTAPADSPELQRYVLYPYLQAARLDKALKAAGSAAPDALDQQIEDFLRAHEQEPVSQSLRRSWLATLATRQRWADFLDHHQPASDDIALRCLGFTARIELDRTEGLAPQVAQTWLTPRSLQECDSAFTWLSGTGGLGPELIEQRVRRALEAGNAAFARQIAARLPVAQAAPLLQWAALIESPQREIDRLIASPGKRASAEALLAGWTRLARANRAGARQRFAPLVRAQKLDQRAASPLALALALALSWDRDPDALKFFARVDPKDFDDSAREWQARAALWAHDFKQVSRSIAAMTEANRRTARWRYWSARAATHEGRDAVARQLYESILGDDNFYSAMAAARLRQSIAPHPQPLPPDTAVLTSLADQPGMVRARELLATGLTDLARTEWRDALDELPAGARSQSIHLAASWGWYHQAVTMATSERVFNDYALLYPRPYDTEVAAAVQLSGLPAPLVYGVIRQESLYQRDAVSSADARGLMQLTMETARRTARSWKQPSPTATSLLDSSVNVTLGAAHLKDLLEQYSGQLPLALASYNAGPGATQRWLPASEMDPDIWIENIPYNETRTYVQRILWHTVVFKWLEQRQDVDTRQWLDAIGPTSPI